MSASIRILTIHLAPDQQAQAQTTFTRGEFPPFIMHASDLANACDILQTQSFDLVMTDPVTYDQMIELPLSITVPVMIIREEGIPPRFAALTRQQVQQNNQEINALRKSEKLFRLLVNSTADIIALHDKHLRLLFINPAQENILGWPASNLIGKNFLEYIHPDDRENIQKTLTQQSQTRTDHVLQWRCRRPDGGYVWLETNFTHLPPSSPFQADLLTHSRDISARRLAEEEIRSKEHLYHNIVSESLDGIVMVDHEGTVCEWNRGLERITGYSAEQIVGEPFWSVMHRMRFSPESPDKFREAFLAQMHMIMESPSVSMKEQMGEQKIIRSDGTTCIIQAISFVVPGKDRPMMGSIVRDVTQLVTTREALLAERRLFTEGPIVVIRWNFAPGYPVEYASDNVSNLLGCTAEDLTSGQILYADLIHPDDRQHIAPADVIERVREKHHTGLTFAEGDYRIVRADGQVRWVHDYTRIIATPQGEIQYLQGYLLDITDRIQIEEELKHVNQQLKNWIDELEQRNAAANLLNSIGDLLQICNSVEDTYSVLEQYAPQMFRDQDGALYLSNGQSDQMRLCVEWGKNHPKNEVVMVSDCWGLRRGRTHFMDNLTVKLRCRHVPKQSETISYLCVPISVQGKNIGLLHQEVPTGAFSDQWEQLAESLAEQLGLVIANIRLRETLREQALHDPLTGLYNRYFMEESLDRELAQAERSNLPVSIIMLDLDHFKDLNTRFGHPNVDEMLGKFGVMLRNFVRQGDIACRYGGDEFLLIFPGAPIAAAFKRAEQLRQQVKLLSVRSENGDEKHLTVSIGVAAYPENGLTTASILRAADAALYQAKAIHDTVILSEPNDSLTP